MRVHPALLCLLLLPWSARGKEASPQWVEVRSGHFLVLSDASEKQARHVAGELEKMRAVFQVLMPAATDNAAIPIVVLAVKTKKDFQALEPAAYLTKGSLDLTGLFMRAPDKNYILLRLDAQGDHPLATVYHEYTHYMTRNASEWLPLWLNEGLAEFYQNSDIREKDVLLGEANVDDILYLRQNRLLPLTTLLAVDARSPYYHEERKGSVFYAESWALTHYIEMNDAQKSTHRLQDYAALMSKKSDPVAAAQQAFGNLKDLENALYGYIAQGQFLMFKMKQTTPVDEAGFTAQPVTASDADATRADVLVYNRRTQDAQVLLDGVLRESPNNALAHETMGFLKFRENDLESAKKWYGEAVKLNSQSYLALYYFGAISMGAHGDGQDPAIASSLETSIHLNPSFAPAYDALASYYAHDPSTVSKAHLLNIQAILLEPNNIGYRLNAANVLLAGQNYQGALGVLNKAMRVAQKPEDVMAVQMRIDSLVRYQEEVKRREQTVPDSAAVSSLSPNTIVTDTRTQTITSGDGRVYVIKADSATGLPSHPTEAPNGKHHVVSGVIRKVQCGYPSKLALTIEAEKGGSIALYCNDFREIEFSAASSRPKDDLNPCTDIEGIPAKVVYAEVADKSVAGQILSVQLSR